MVELGIVEKVRADEPHYWSSGLHLQSKPDGSERPCGDFRLVNNVTLQTANTLPNLNHFTNHIKRSKVFSKVDMSKAFHFIPIKKEDQIKVCVNTPWGLYKFLRMPFGLKNAPGSFQAFANEVLNGIPNCYVYLDDIIVFSESEEQHQKTVRAIFERFQKYGLALSLSKCQFAAEEVDF